MDIQKVLSIMASIQVICCAEGKDDAEQLTDARKLGAYLSKTLGMSLRDLPQNLRTRIDEMGKKKLGSLSNEMTLYYIYNFII